VSLFDTISNMNSTHKKTLAAVYAEPVSASLEWRRIEALLVAIGCRVIEGNGSRVRFEKDEVVATFHRPHPTKEAKPYQVRDARHYLESLGVKP
jgi:HicA toxin of bacterial toxin-antitoxin,